MKLDLIWSCEYFSVDRLQLFGGCTEEDLVLFRRTPKISVDFTLADVECAWRLPSDVDSLKKIPSGNLFEPKDFEGISFHSGG